MADVKTDRYGRTVTHTTENEQEVYSTDGITVRFPLGAGWDRALRTIEAHIPISVLES
jgi:hypothetical protein